MGLGIRGQDWSRRGQAGDRAVVQPLVGAPSVAGLAFSPTDGSRHGWFQRPRVWGWGAQVYSSAPSPPDVPRLFEDEGWPPTLLSVAIRKTKLSLQLALSHPTASSSGRRVLREPACPRLTLSRGAVMEIPAGGLWPACGLVSHNWQHHKGLRLALEAAGKWPPGHPRGRQAQATRSRVHRGRRPLGLTCSGCCEARCGGVWGQPRCLPPANHTLAGQAAPRQES